ncbi:MAG: outer membrane lipoprotein-sorting protein [Helicobacteraceae bacterium]|jgi:outer membrane lipoprotein-sorting protein|nr:outer membrane lipoprotein-sorting protein [Helicobacteraceae bacterium]
MKRLVFVLLLCAAAFADDPKAREIMQKVDARNDGDRMTARMEMILIDKNKNQRIRLLKQFRRYEGKDSYRAIFFLEPADVRNTGFLTYDYDDSDKDDDQWLYLPALKKSKRIASGDKSGSFMGSDFSYSDMADRELDDYDFKLIEERNVGEHKTWVIESVPRSQKAIDETGYTKSLLQIRQDNYVIIRAVNYETKQGRVKMLDVPKLELIDGIWQPLEMQMVSRQGKETLHSTILRFYDVKFNQEMPDDLFTLRHLESGL